MPLLHYTPCIETVASCLPCHPPPFRLLQGPCGPLRSRSWAINAARPLIFVAILAGLLCCSEASVEEPGGAAAAAPASRDSPSIIMSNKGTHHSWHPQMGSSRRQSTVSDETPAARRGSLISLKSIESFFHESSKEDVSVSLLTTVEKLHSFPFLSHPVLTRSAIHLSIYLFLQIYIAGEEVTVYNDIHFRRVREAFGDDDPILCPNLRQHRFSSPSQDSFQIPPTYLIVPAHRTFSFPDSCRIATRWQESGPMCSGWAYPKP
jgi:hypothetical protein